ncbi:MAG: alpha/beta fold hydrolase [Reyranella sp.]|nr:alpha/beta fold hydrolase [Reyranella sp.]
MQTSIPSLEVPSFRPRFPWWGGDLQTMANRLRRAAVDLAPHAGERLHFPLADGTGDTLLATLHRPAMAKAGAPLVLLIHGLTGSEDSHYILSQARLLLDRGHRVLRLNLRGAGPSRALCAGHYYAGRSQDFRMLLSLLPAEFARDGLAAVGYSLGGAMLLKYLGEEGGSSPLKAAASVCAPIDLAITCRNMMRPRNRIYHHHLLGQMKSEATGEGAVLSAAEREAIMSSRTVWEYDDAFIAPHYGFGSAENYYERCKPLRFMTDIRVPTLMLAAGNDPWIPDNLYRGYDWAANKALVPLLPVSGGHVGFHGAGSDQPWSDIVIARFLEHG